MESHPVRSHVKEKHFKHYLFEFFMLFLAVTLGFFVENIREHLVENSREKDYVRSIAEDLKQDISQLDTIIHSRIEKDKMIDSLLYLVNYTNIDERGNDIYYYARWAPRTYRFYQNERTFLQLNSGNWRLIRNKKVSDALLSYNEVVKSLSVYIEQREESLILIMYSSIDKLFDNRVFQKMLNGLSFNHPEGKPQLLIKDKVVLNEFCNQVHFVQNANYFFINNSTILLNNAKKTLALLKNEYKL